MKFAATTFALVLATAMGASSAFAADPAPAKSLTPQQQKMKECNAQATGKTGDERKAFMSACLKTGGKAATAAPSSGSAAALAQTPQQQKMKECNAQATGKKGEERKAFMSTCLKADNSANATAPAAASAQPLSPQQQKMKACNADAAAKHLQGEDRKAYMSTCLKNDSAAPATH